MAVRHLDLEEMSDMELAARAAERDVAAIRMITTRNNQRLFRAAWSVVRNESDAEEVVQEAYLKAFGKMASFTGKSSLSTWLTRIVLNTALDRLRMAQRRKTDLISQDVAVLDAYRESHSLALSSPEHALMRQELAVSLQHAIGQLKEEYRSVFVLRDLEGMSVEETAQALSLSTDVVKTRLSRARKKLRELLQPQTDMLLQDVLPFAGAACDRMTANVLSLLDLPNSD